MIWQVRAQLTVLKNVVVEEKSVTTELKVSKWWMVSERECPFFWRGIVGTFNLSPVSLQNQMRQKDQNIRRLEQETESLRFCNGQMQSRLLVLQKDLKEKDSKSKNVNSILRN